MEFENLHFYQKSNLIVCIPYELNATSIFFHNYDNKERYCFLKN